MTRTTWRPIEKSGDLGHGSDQRDDLPDSAFAVPKERKEPITDAGHVRSALARFDQVKGVSDEERDLAFANIEKAGKHFVVDIAEKDWRELGKQPHTSNPAH